VSALEALDVRRAETTNRRCSRRSRATARAEVAAGAERLGPRPRAPAGGRPPPPHRAPPEGGRGGCPRAGGAPPPDGDVLGAVGRRASPIPREGRSHHGRSLSGRVARAVNPGTALRDGTAIARAPPRSWKGPARLLPQVIAGRRLDLATRPHAPSSRDWARGRGRASGRRPLPDAIWVLASEERLKAVEDALRDIHSGPLGRPISAGSLPTPPGAYRDPPAPRGAEATEHSPRPGHAPAPAARRGVPDRSLLWVDGVGSYLILGGDRVTIGRPSTSARPDIALLAELEGIHAEVPGSSRTTSSCHVGPQRSAGSR
jgi:hypothetical protein